MSYRLMALDKKKRGFSQALPQRLKPYCPGSTYGTDKSVPLTGAQVVSIAGGRLGT
jgi:hypothetical protein